MITTNKSYGTSIQHKIFVSIRRILVITLLLIGIFSALVIRNQAQKTAVNNSNELLQMISQNMNQVIDSIDNSSKQVALNEQVINYCKNAESLTEYECIMIDMQLKNSCLLYTSRGASCRHGSKALWRESDRPGKTGSSEWDSQPQKCHSSRGIY